MEWNNLDLSIHGLQQSYQNNDFSIRELVAYLTSLQAEDAHHIWIKRLSLNELEPYLQRLEQSDSSKLPLYGIPFAIKDNIDLAAVDTTAGCEAFRFTPGNNATVVENLVQAGAIPMGKTNLDQFATGLVGTRSPWGACKNSLNAEYISGGSSSGSAVATAMGLVSFALGTDTAGSGRVPAALNNIIGIKPTRGLISCSGVVPACKSLDCVSIFALNIDDANLILSLAESYDAEDEYSRRNQFENSQRRYGVATETLTLAVPAAHNLEFFGDSHAERLFTDAVNQLKEMGHKIHRVDIQPLLDAAKLLYEGPWVSERFIATESLMENNPQAALPVIQTIIGSGKTKTALESFKAEYQLQKYRQQSALLLQEYDCLITPTAPTAYTIQQVEDDPIRLNSNMGTYTNFMNLLDMSSIAIPAGFLPNGVGFGITLQAGAFKDRLLLSIANAIGQHQSRPIGIGHYHTQPTQVNTAAPADYVDLVVCGAHLEGMPLNWQLHERGALKRQLTSTSEDYRLYAMQDGRPALIRDDNKGAAIEVEIWRIDKSEFGSFVADIPAPLGIGKIQLQDENWYSSFIAESRAVENAQEITHFGGWRAYQQNKQ